MKENWGAKSCLSQDWGNLTDKGQQCPPVWDGFTCWGPTAMGTVAYSRCPHFKGSDVTKLATRVCSPLGEWLDRNGSASSTGWTNYTLCLTPEIREIIKRLGSNDDAQSKFNIAVNTRILEFVGLSLSLAALLLSLLIFYYFRTLRNSRTRLHRHLFIAMVIQVGIRLIVYADQAITRSIDTVSTLNTNSSVYVSFHSSRNDAGENIPFQQRRGIDNTPILCEASYISLEYARTAMFMWMFVEALFLHNVITVTVFEEKLSPLVYPFIGWIVPIPLTVVWAVVTHWHYGTATCWWGYNFTAYFWILEGPRLAVLIINLAFLLNILRVLVTKLRQSNSSEIQQALKAVKAALLLLPLFGLTNLLNMLDAPLENSPFHFALWSYTTHLLTSTQGLVLAFLYCFRNGEVQIAVRNFVRVRILNNTKHIILYKTAIPLSTLDNGSLYKSCSNQCHNGAQMMSILNRPDSPVVVITKCGGSTMHSQNEVSYQNVTSSGHEQSPFQSSIVKFSRSSLQNYSRIPLKSSQIGSQAVVRSFSNGTLKQVIVKEKLRSIQNLHSDSSIANCDEYQSLHNGSSSSLIENSKIFRQFPLEQKSEQNQKDNDNISEQQLNSSSMSIEESSTTSSSTFS